MNVRVENVEQEIDAKIDGEREGADELGVGGLSGLEHGQQSHDHVGDVDRPVVRRFFQLLLVERGVQIFQPHQIH